MSTQSLADLAASRGVRLWPHAVLDWDAEVVKPAIQRDALAAFFAERGYAVVRERAGAWLLRVWGGLMVYELAATTYAAALDEAARRVLEAMPEVPLAPGAK